MPDKFENATSFFRLGLPSTLIGMNLILYDFSGSFAFSNFFRISVDRKLFIRFWPKPVKKDAFSNLFGIVLTGHKNEKISLMKLFSFKNEITDIKTKNNNNNKDPFLYPTYRSIFIYVDFLIIQVY